MQRRESAVVASFQLRARAHEQRDDGSVLVGRRVVENGVAPVVRVVRVVVAGQHVRALLQAAGEVRSRGEVGEGARVPVLAVGGIGDPAAIVPREGVGAQPQQLAVRPRVRRSPLAPGHVQGRQPEGAPGAGVGARFHQDGDDFRELAPVGRQMQRRGPVRVPRVRIRAGVEALAHVVRGGRPEEGKGVPVVAGVALLFRLPEPPNLGQAVQRLVVLGVVPRREAFVVDGRAVGAELQERQEGGGIVARGHVQGGAAVPAPPFDVRPERDEGLYDGGIPVAERGEVQRRRVPRIRDVPNCEFGQEGAGMLNRHRGRIGWPPRVHVGPRPNERLDHRRVAVGRRGFVEGRRAVQRGVDSHVLLGTVADRLQVRSGLDQQVDHGGVLVPGGRRMEGRPSHPLAGVHVRSGLQQDGGDFGVLIAGREVQGRLPVVGPRVHVRARVQQRPHHLRVRVGLRGEVQRGPVPSPVDAEPARAHVHLRTGLQQRAHDGRGASRGRVVEGRAVAPVAALQCRPGREKCRDRGRVAGRFGGGVERAVLE